MSTPASLRAALDEWLDHDRSAPALRGDRGDWLSRSDLAEQLEAGRTQLRQRGLSPSDRVGLLMPMGLDSALASLQVACACSLAPLRPGLRAPQWRDLLVRLAPAALVADPLQNPELAGAAAALAIPVITPEELRCRAASPPEQRPDSLGTGQAGQQTLLLSTSGSTGEPKWAQHHQAGLLRGLLATARSLALTPRDRALLALPLHHAHGLVSGLLMPLITGGSVVVMAEFDPGRVLRCLQAAGITWCSLAPAMHRSLLDQHGRTPLARPHDLRFLRSGAVALPEWLIEAIEVAFGVPMIEAYGMTECPQISGNPIGAPRAGSVGLPLVESLKIVDAAGQTLPAGAWGEVLVRGAPVMEGYLHPGSTLSEAYRDGWLHTGDSGLLDRDGYLHLRGRLSERINRGGLKVMPATVDAVLLGHPQVQEAVTFPVSHPTLGNDLAAAVVLRPGAMASGQELRRHGFSLLAAHEVPSTILAVEALPRGATGKVQRMALAELLRERIHPHHEPLKTPLEHRIAAAFASVLGQPPCGREANFFLLGGDSLSGQRVISSLAHQLGLELSSALLFRCPTVRGLAETLASLLAAGHAGSVAAAVETPNAGAPASQEPAAQQDVIWID